MRRLPPFPALRAFEAAGRLRSFALAAQELHLTPSAVSHQVRQLEAHFGTPLFERRVRGVALTPEGERLLAGLTSALDAIEAACGTLGSAAEAGDALALHCAPSFATQWLQPRLPALLQALPGLAPKLSSGADAVDLAARRDLDLWIAYGSAPAQPGVQVLALGDEHIAPLAAPALLAAAGDGGPSARLARLPLIDSALSPVGWPQWFVLNALTLPPAPRASVDRAALAIALAADGVGAVLESTRLAEREIARGALVVVGEAEGAFQPLARPLHFLCWRRADAQNPRIRRFREWLLAALAVPG